MELIEKALAEGEILKFNPLCRTKDCVRFAKFEIVGASTLDDKYCKDCMEKILKEIPY